MALSEETERYWGEEEGEHPLPLLRGPRSMHLFCFSQKSAKAECTRSPCSLPRTFKRGAVLSFPPKMGYPISLPESKISIGDINVGKREKSVGSNVYEMGLKGDTKGVKRERKGGESYHFHSSNQLHSCLLSVQAGSLYCSS